MSAIASLFLGLALMQGPDLQDSTAQASLNPDVEAARLESLVRSICTVETAGRETTTPGYLVAAQTVAAELGSLGVMPGGDDGFLQWVPMTLWSVLAPEEGAEVPTPRLILTDKEGVEHEYLCGIDFELPVGRSGAPPEPRILDLLVVDSPEALPDEPDEDVALYFTSAVRRDQRQELLVSKGQTLGDWGLYIDARSSNPGRQEVVPAPYLTLDYGVDDPGDVILVRSEAKAKFVSGDVARVRLDVKWRRDDTACANVVGIIPGIGTPDAPELAEEVVVLIANLDHLGVGSRDLHGSQDRTYDGADNNASGVAALLEIAEALMHEPPARTTLLLFATGEEQGQLGVKHQLIAPALPLSRTVVALELWAMGAPDELVPPPAGLWCTDFTETTVGPALQQADLPILMDERPRWHYDTRSPTHQYVLAGIVGHRLSSYGGHNRLNTPKDEAGTLDYAHLERVTRTALATVRLLTNGSIPIEKL